MEVFDKYTMLNLLTFIGIRFIQCHAFQKFPFTKGSLVWHKAWNMKHPVVIEFTGNDLLAKIANYHITWDILKN